MTLTGDVGAVNAAKLTEAFEHFARAHGLVRSDSAPRTSRLTTLKDRRIAYENDEVYIVFYASGTVGEVTVGLEPGVADIPAGFIANASAAFEPFGFKARQG